MASVAIEAAALTNGRDSSTGTSLTHLLATEGPADSQGVSAPSFNINEINLSESGDSGYDTSKENKPPQYSASEDSTALSPPAVPDARAPSDAECSKSSSHLGYSDTTSTTSNTTHRHSSHGITSPPQDANSLLSSPPSPASLPQEEDAGAEMLLMMRRNKSNSSAPLPASLDKVTMRAPQTPKSASSTTPRAGLPSSHSYYRSANVLASPVLREHQASRPQFRNLSQDMSNPEKLAAATSTKLRVHPERAADVRYEQQRLRKPVAYRVPPEVAIAAGTGVNAQHWSSTKVEKPQGSPRIYIPPPIFSSQHGRPPLHHRTHSEVPSSSINRKMSQVASPRDSSAASAPEMKLRTATEQLHYMHQPYKSLATQPSRRLSPPRYQDYYDETLPSPIRESFIRSSSRAGTHDKSPLPERWQTDRQPYQPIRYAGSKRGAIDDPEDVRIHPTTGMRYITPHARHSTTIDPVAANSGFKRARADSRESMSSGSSDGGELPEQVRASRMKYIAPDRPPSGGPLIPHSVQMGANKPHRHHHGQSPARGPSPIPEPHSMENRTSEARSGPESGESLLNALLSHVGSTNNVDGLEGRANAATALTDVAAALVRVAQELRGSN